MTRKKIKKISPARVASLDVLDAVRRGSYVEEALLRVLGPDLGQKDRALATEICYGALRWRTRLDSIIDKCLNRPDASIKPKIRDILRIGLFQLFLLDRIPEHAAVNESVEQAKTAGGPAAANFVNAVMRNALRNRESVDQPPGNDPEALALWYSHPEWLVKRWISNLGYEGARRALEFNNSRADLNIRVNSIRTSIDRVMEILTRNGIDWAPSPLLRDALKVNPSGAPVSELPGFAQGLFTAQDPASQMISHLVNPLMNERILDACAASGGKTAHLAALTDNSAKIVAVDMDQNRLKAMSANLKRLGATCVSAIKGDAGDPGFLKGLGLFDTALVDAPCSNLGTLRHNPEVKYRIRPEHLPRLADQQLRILRAVANIIKPGGRIIYSVCAVTREENMGVIDRFLESRPEFKIYPIDHSPRPLIRNELINDTGCFNTFGKETLERMDSFFAVVLGQGPGPYP